MGRKYTNPDASGYLLEAKACEAALAEKFQRTVDKEAAARQSELETAPHYKVKKLLCLTGKSETTGD